MLDHVSISHASGIVLWSKSFSPTFRTLATAPNSPINLLIKDIMIENKAAGKAEEEGIERDGFSVRWTVENGLGLVFVVVFPALLPLSYIPAFLLRVKALFLSLFQPYLRALVDSLSASASALQSSTNSALSTLRSQLIVERWEAIFDRCLRSFEGGSNKSQGGRNKVPIKSPMPLSRKAQLSATAVAQTNSGSPPSSADERVDPLTAEEIAKNVAAMKGKLKSGGSKGKSGSARSTTSGSPSPSRPNTRSHAKVMRKWDNSEQQPMSEAELAQLDFSGDQDRGDTPDSSVPQTPIDVESLVSTSAMGQVGKDGLYEVADWDTGRKAEDLSGALPSEEEILARGSLNKSFSSLGIKDNEEKVETKPAGKLSSLFARFSGSKVLNEEDLKPILAEMEKHLMSKNVAKEIAEKMCETVGLALRGKKVGGFSSIKSEVQSAMSDALTRVLTSKSSTDILLDIKRKAALVPPVNPMTGVADTAKDPYAITFVGVNGVGKSTNLSKVCFWLLQNKMRVLIAACDTFRAGAVEQLRVHVRNLGLLEQQTSGGDAGILGSRSIELFERGYGKDAAGIAKEAIAYAKENKFDVVLIDTAGRMQDNEPLMRALAKLVSVNNPDKIVFVGEALVGNEAVDQLSKFDKALKDFTSAGVGVGREKSKTIKPRGIDGMILTKFDTIVSTNAGRCD